MNPEARQPQKESLAQNERPKIEPFPKPTHLLTPNANYTIIPSDLSEVTCAGLDIGTENGIVIGTDKNGGPISTFGNVPAKVGVVKKSSGGKKGETETFYFGSDALELEDRTDAKIICPLDSALVDDAAMTGHFMRYLLEKIRGKQQEHFWSKKMVSSRLQTVVASIPFGLKTQYHRDSMVAAAKEANIEELCFVAQPMAGLYDEIGDEIMSPTGVCLIDSGGGATHVIVVSMGEIQAHETITTASGKIATQEIKTWLDRRKGLEVSSMLADEIKLAACTGVDYRDVRVEGDELVFHACIKGKLNDRRVKIAEVHEVLQGPAHIMGDAAYTTLMELRKTKPRLNRDIALRPIYVIGGNSGIPGLDEVFREEFGDQADIRISPDSQRRVVDGCAKLLGNRPLLDHIKIDRVKL